MSLSRARILSLAALAAAWSCGGETEPLAQWKVYLATDAPVPALGQQVLVELIDGEGRLLSRSARRLIDGSRPELWPISFGVVPETGAAPPRVRARFYRLDETGPDGLPSGTTMIDAAAVLPRTGNGVTETVLPLRMACFGVETDLPGHRTCDPGTGRLGPEPTLSAGVHPSSFPTVGTWPPAASVPCSSAPPSGMACAAGGVFILGSAHYFPSADPVPEHLVQLDPFAIDVDEVTVGQIRPLVRAGRLAAPATHDPDALSAQYACTYPGDSDSSRDAYPVNCVPWTTADLACALLGKRLPRETEWEYVAGGLTAKLPFPWGTDTNICHYAIVASGTSESGDTIECLDPTLPPGPRADDGTGLDVVDSDVPGVGGRVRNMAGNVSEWTADIFDAYSGPCWQTGSSLLVRPLCVAAVAHSSEHTIRGGSWADDALSAHVYVRDQLAGDLPSPSTGFRCARSM